MDIPQGWRCGNGIRDAEAKALRLPGPVVWILTNDDDLCLRERCQGQRAELHPCWRIDSIGCPLSGEATDEGLACIGCEHRCEDRMPVGGTQIR